MSTEITVLTKQDLEANPSIIGQNLAQLALAIENTKSDLSEIQNRSFWQKLTNNNTRDLAEAMLKQNDTISAFLIIVQGIMFLSMNNLIVLGGIMDALNKTEETNDLRDNKYIGMAKDYLTEAIKSAQKASSNEKEIEKIKIELIAYYKNQENQDRLMSDLKKGIAAHDEEYKRQAKLIDKMSVKLDEKQQLDEEQNKFLKDLNRRIDLSVELIEKQKVEHIKHAESITKLDKNISENKQLVYLQDKENERQNELIQQLQKAVENNVERLSSQDIRGNSHSLQIEQLKLELRGLKKRLTLAYTVGGVGLFLAIAAIILVFLK